MTWWTTFYYYLLNLPIRLLVKSKAIPVDPISELNLDNQQPMLYVLPYNSKADLLALRQQCLKFNFPDPLKFNRFQGQNLPRYVFIDKGPRLFPYYTPKDTSIQTFEHYMQLHQEDNAFNVQMIPVSVMFGRAPGRTEQKTLNLKLLNGLQKFWAVLFFGRDCFVRFSNAVHFRYIVDELHFDEQMPHKLSRVARIHFYRQRLVAVGPRIPLREQLFKKLLRSKAIEKAVEEEAKIKEISLTKAQKNAVKIMKEITANTRYPVLMLTDRILTWAWSRIYQGLKVTNAEVVRQLAEEGHEIVYAPCHRSHMDYLLLSYVLYQQGVVPPHIAAGINLNFWPAGPIFRSLGAFFIRRTFKDKLYTVIFREYLAELFQNGYSVEYFVEGGRSRTGRLLEPKTGTLLMTIQAMLRENMRPITIVPVYIGYEHVLEVATYAKELRGMDKEKESFWQFLRAVPRLRKLGLGYVNFGTPIPLNNYLNEVAPTWQQSINVDTQRPTWLLPAVSSVATKLMTHINSAAAVNSINLCSTILLAADQHALTREMLLEQLNFYLILLKQVNYAKTITLPSEEAEALLEHALTMNKFIVENDHAGVIIRLSRENAVLMTYYRNNIQHLFAIPSLLAAILISNQVIPRDELLRQITELYPFIKAELFMHYEGQTLTQYIEAIIDEFIRQELIDIDKFTGTLSINDNSLLRLQLLSANSREAISRYAIALTLLDNNPSISRIELGNRSRLVAERLAILHGVNAPEFFDKGVFATLINCLRSQGYLDNEDHTNQIKISQLARQLNKLLSNNVRQTIQSSCVIPRLNS